MFQGKLYNKSVTKRESKDTTVGVDFDTLSRFYFLQQDPRFCCIYLFCLLTLKVLVTTIDALEHF